MWLCFMKQDIKLFHCLFLDTFILLIYSFNIFLLQGFFLYKFIYE